MDEGHNANVQTKKTQSILTIRREKKRNSSEIIARNPLPLHFYVRINEDTVLPVQVFDHWKCNLATRKRMKKNDEKAFDRPFEEKIWFEKKHEEELYSILKPFLEKNLFRQTLPENSQQDDEGIEILGLRPKLNQHLSTDKTIRIVRGNNIQFTYQFKHTFPHHWSLIRNPRHVQTEIPQVRTKPIVIDDTPPEPIDLTQDSDNLHQHNLDIDTTTPVKKLKPKKASPKKKQASDDDESESIKDEKDQQVSADDQREKTQKIQEQDFITSGIASQQTEPKYFGHKSWKYTLLIFLEPYDPNDNQQREQNADLIIKL